MVKLAGVRPRFSHAAPRFVTPPKRAMADYKSPEWRALVAALIGKRGRRCEDCGATGGRIYGDHVVELRDGGAMLDPGNVRLLCAPCHGRKTERRKRERIGLK